MIRQGPNLLLLDEPTNHLDLEMRQALSVALIEYTGALVVISHDRHLLRSVCDELLIVHDGIVDRFKESLDDYPQWLKDREQKEVDAAQKWQPQAEKQLSKKELRQEQAQQRQRLKPLYDEVRKIDSQLNDKRSLLESLEKTLADESIYSDKDRKDELKELIRNQSTMKTEIDDLEWQWLEASEKLERAQKQLE